MWRKFKFLWMILFSGEPSRADLGFFLSLFPETPVAKATNRGSKWYMEFAIEMDRPKVRSKGTWGNAGKIL